MDLALTTIIVGIVGILGTAANALWTYYANRRLIREEEQRVREAKEYHLAAETGRFRLKLMENANTFTIGEISKMSDRELQQLQEFIDRASRSESDDSKEPAHE